MPHLQLPAVRRDYKCQCGRPVFLRNTQCLSCGSQLGFEVERLTMVAMVPGPLAPLWRVAGETTGLTYRFCVNRQSASACNWLVVSTEPHALLGHLETRCLACRLNRQMFDVTRPVNQYRWRELETAKRRLLSQLLALHLPVEVRSSSVKGIAFDMLEQLPGGPSIVTGHRDGIITLDIAEADDVQRETARVAMGESYRTLLGHFRHEIGHYYWDRLVHRDPKRLRQFRALFGDERADYSKALQKHYRDGARRDWKNIYLSSYSSAHPWEDWAESWAHYLHITDTVDTAASFGIDVDAAPTDSEPIDIKHLWRNDLPSSQAFLDLLNAWVKLTQVMNELSRSMGQTDTYPFVMPFRAVAKLHFIHETITAHRENKMKATRKRTQR